MPFLSTKTPVSPTYASVSFWMMILMFTVYGCRHRPASQFLSPEDQTAYSSMIRQADSMVLAGKPDLALTAYQMAKHAADSMGHLFNSIVLEGTIGRLYLGDLGEISLAETILLSQEDRIQQHPRLPDALRVRNYLDLAGVYRRRYDLAHAESYAMMAFYTLSQGRLQDSLLLSRTYAAIGALYHQKNEPDSAYSFLHLSKQYYPAHATPTLGNLDWLIAWINRCNNEDLSQPIRRAVGRYWLEYYQRLGEQDPFIRTDAFRMKSIFFWIMQEHDSCIYYADLAIQGYHTLGDVQPYPRAFTYAIKSGSLLAQGRFSEGHAALDSALWFRFGTTHQLEAFKKDIYSVDVLSSKAEALLDEGIRTQHISKVVEALALYDQIYILQRHFAKWDTDGHIHNKVYTNFFYTYQVKACAYLYRTTGSQAWLVRLHDLLATYKGELFVRERRMQDIRSRGVKEQNLFLNFLENDSRLEQALFEAGKKSFEERIGDFPAIHQLYKEKKRLTEALEADTLALLEAVRDHPHITSDEMLDYCQDVNAAVINYYIGDRFYNPDSIYGLVASRKGLDLVSFKYDSALESAIRAVDQVHRLTVRQEEDAPDPDYLRHSHGIFRQIVHPVLRRLESETSLVFIPDGDLHQVTFEGLVMEYPPSSEGVSWNDPSVRYVVDSFNVSYAFSPDRLLPDEEGDRRFPLDIVGMAYTDMKTLVNQDSLMLPELFGSVKDMEVLQNQFGDNRARYITGYQLNRREFFRYAPKARVLHLSTHGQFIPGVRRSGMLYVRNGKAIDEIYQFELRFAGIRPKLLVLSACDSGAGEVVMEEGMMSIGRVFQATGAGRVISARWPVSDRASTDFFQAFYLSYREKGDVNEALHKAQFSLRWENSRFAFPGYWAGFALFL